MSQPSEITRVGGLAGVLDKAATWLFGQPAAVVLVAVIAGVLLYAIHVELPFLSSELREGLREQQERFERWSTRQADECEKGIERQREHDKERTQAIHEALAKQSDAIIENTRQLQLLCERCARPVAEGSKPATASASK